MDNYHDQKENETFEQDINSIENNEEIPKQEHCINVQIVELDL